MLAAEKGNTECLQALLSADADPNIAMEVAPAPFRDPLSTHKSPLDSGKNNIQFTCLYLEYRYYLGTCAVCIAVTV